MDEYIRRGAAIEQFENSTSAIPEKLARIRIKGIPAADVSPVRHGRWIEVEHGGSGVLCECSACKEWMLFYYGFDANYCPNCGAKMDGGRDE